MDPINSVNIKKDSSFAILLEAQKREYEIHYMEKNFLYLKNNLAYSKSYTLCLYDNLNCWYKFLYKNIISLSDLDVILMRLDPPVDNEFLYVTYILEYAEKNGVLVINKPRSIRNNNEKIIIMNFRSYIPDTLISCNKNEIFNFLNFHKSIILKPINKMCGKMVFKVNHKDTNFSVIFEVLTNYGNNFCIAQKYISNVNKGDKRIFIINGIPAKSCLVRIPSEKDNRANLAAGGTGYVTTLSDRDIEISRGISKYLINEGLIFVGIDVIDGYLTEINFTSPTCIREIDNECSISIASTFIDVIEEKLRFRNI